MKSDINMIESVQYHHDWLFLNYCADSFKASVSLRAAITVLAIAGSVLTGSVNAATTTTLSLTSSDVFIDYLTDMGGTNTVIHAPLVASASIGGVSASADFSLGSFKDRSFSIASGPNSGSGAASGFDALFKNTGPRTISFSAGDISATVGATFLHPPCVDVSCAEQNQLYASLTGTGPSLSGQTSTTYMYQDVTGREPYLDFILTPTSGFTATGFADTASMSAVLALPAFTLEPQQFLHLIFKLQTLAGAGGVGSTATTDAAHSAQMSMLLPADVTLISPAPLNWIAPQPVPLPASVWFFFAGIMTLVGFLRNHKLK